MDKPASAIIAVTFRCNSRCIMCDIWKRKDCQKKELPASFYAKLPNSLKDINLTGGEPFLRSDFMEIIKVIKKNIPKTRLLVNTNGFAKDQIRKIIPAALRIDPNFAVRVSLDGFGKVHDQIRGVTGGFKKALSTLEYFKKIGIKDLGTVFTLTSKNQQDLLKVFNYTLKNNLDFSLNIVHESPIYFGDNKLRLSADFLKIKKDIDFISNKLRNTVKVKNWGRVWFNNKLMQFYVTKKRPVPCGAGNDFFYLNPYGKVYACHLRKLYLGDLKKSSFEEIWKAKKRVDYQKKTSICNDCWMICTVKDQMKKNKIKILAECINDYIKDL